MTWVKDAIALSLVRHLVEILVHFCIIYQKKNKKICKSGVIFTSARSAPVSSVMQQRLGGRIILWDISPLSETASPVKTEQALTTHLAV